MPDISLLVFEIRAFLQRDDQTMNDRLVQLATIYAEECSTINKRLAVCGQLLAQGLRSEAIQQAEADPDALELVAALDFPERNQWEGLVDLYGLPRPPELLLSIAGEINKAYAEENPLRDLLKQHRRLALMRAPLAKRTAVLEEIATRDTTNPVWQIDLASYQKVRLEEIKEEAKNAAKSANRAAIAALQNEVMNGLWVDPPPAALVIGLEQSHQTLTRNEARAELPNLEIALQNAVVQSDVDKARKLSKQWQATIQRAGLAATDPISVRIAPTLQWVDRQNQRDAEQQEFESDLVRLEEALAEAAPIDDIMNLAAQVMGHDREVPADLVERYEARLEHEEKRKQLVRYGSYGAVAACLALIISWVMYSSWYSGRSKVAEQHARQIAEALEVRDIEAAQTLLMQIKDNDPGLLNFSSLDRAWSLLDLAQKDEAKRVHELESIMTEIEQGLTLPRVVGDLSKARTLARTGEERATLNALDQRRQKQLAKEQADSDAVLLTQVDVLAKGLDAIDLTLKGSNPSNASRELSSLAEQARGLSDRLAEAGPFMKAKGDETLRRLAIVQQAATKAEERQLAQTALDEAVKALPLQVENYANVLQRYRLTLSVGSLLTEADHTSNEKSAWLSALAECRLQAAWTKVDRRNLSPNEAKKRIADLKDASKDLDACPDRELFATYQTLLKAVAARLESGGIPQLERIASDPLICKVSLVSLLTKPGKRYYTVDTIDKKTAFFHYYIDFMPEHNEKKPAKLNDFEKCDLAPQVEFAKVLNADLPGLKDGTVSWEATILKLLEMIRGNTEIDPILRLDLIDVLMQVGSNGSPPLNEALEGHRQVRSTLKTKRGLRWMNPEDATSYLERPKIEEGLKRIPEFARLAEAVAEDVRKQELFGRNLPRVVGWLQHGQGAIQCRTVSVGSDGGGLYVVVPAGQGGNWKKIGDWRDGSASLSFRNPELLQEGRLVFFKPEPQN